MKIFEVKEKCSQCDGTGLYVGLAERDGASVVCSHCKGSGCFEFKHEYEEFSSRTIRKGIKRVLQNNVGIVVGSGDNCKLEDFGGITYKEWLNDGKFPNGSEMRNYSCPAWWYQCSDYDKKPNWDECIFGGSFSSCKHFCDKSKCWERSDNELKLKR